MTNANDLVTTWLGKFDAALRTQDVSAAAALFAEQCFWRDLVSFTWNLKTLEGRAEIDAMLKATLSDVRPSNWQRQGDATENNGMVESWFTFETAVARGKGHLRLKDGLAWTLLTTMVELKGLEEKNGPRRILGAEHGASKTRTTWLEKREKEERELGSKTQPYCLIIGGGQGGIILGARLRKLSTAVQDQLADGIEMAVDACGIQITDSDEHRRIDRLDNVGRFVWRNIHPLRIDHRPQSSRCDRHIRCAFTGKRDS